jgi:hypothetical protein
LRGGGEIHVETKKVTFVPDESTPQIKVISWCQTFKYGG